MAGKTKSKDASASADIDWDAMQNTDTLFVSEELRGVVNDILSSSQPSVPFRFILAAGDYSLTLDLLRIEQAIEATTVVGTCTQSSVASILARNPREWTEIEIFRESQTLLRINLSDHQVETSIEMPPGSDTCIVTLISKATKPKQKKVL